MRVSTCSASRGDPLFGDLPPPRSLEREGLGHHGHREGADVLRHLRDDGGRAGAGAAPHAAGDEDHIGALEEIEDLLVGLERGVAADLRIGAGAETAGQLGTELELDRRHAGHERLLVGVGGDELDTGEPGRDHPVHRVAPATADPNHPNPGRRRSFVEEDPRLGFVVEQGRIVVVQIVDIVNHITIKLDHAHLPFQRNHRGRRAAGPTGHRFAPFAPDVRFVDKTAFGSDRRPRPSPVRTPVR